MYIHTDIIVTARLVLGLLNTKYKQGEVQHQVKSNFVDDPLHQVVLSLQWGVQQQSQGVEAHTHAVIDPLWAAFTQVSSLTLQAWT